MSGLYKDKGSSRIKYEEVFKLRDEIYSIIKKSDENILKENNFIIDSYGNKNLLLQNILTDKEDNGDLDLFILKDKNTNPEIILKDIFKLSDEVQKNGKVYSILYNSSILSKKVQIDIHMFEGSIDFKYSYFAYYQTPYLGYIVGKILNKLDIKISEEGVFKNIYIDNGKGSKIKSEVKITRDIYTFLYKIVGLKLETPDMIKKINSFTNIKELLDSSILKNYNYESLFFNDTNEKIKKIFNNSNSNSNAVNTVFDVEGLGNHINLNLEKNYPYIISKVNNKIKFINDSIKEKNNINLAMKRFFNVNNLGEVDNLVKPFIKGFIDNIKDLTKLKEINDKIKEYINITNSSNANNVDIKSNNVNNSGIKDNNFNIYAVGGCVRDIILGGKINDCDICGDITSEKFAEIMGGSITDKMGTVVTTYKGLEIEYTPFRSEGVYEGRKPKEIILGVSLEDDSRRRDLTINSLYLSLKDGKIIDLYGGINDIKNGIIKYVLSPENRFNEDYLRILRCIRFKSVLEEKGIDAKYDDKTRDAMILLSGKLNEASDFRIVEEYMKGIKNKTYLKNLNEYGNNIKDFNIKDSNTEKKLSNKINISDVQKVYNNTKDIYVTLYHILLEDIERFKLIHNFYISDKNIFVYAHKIYKTTGDQYLNLKNTEDVRGFLFDISSNSNGNILNKYGDYKNFINYFSLFNVLDGKINISDMDFLIKKFHNIWHFGDPFTLKGLKAKGYDFNKYIKENNLNAKDALKYIKDDLQKGNYKNLVKK